MNGAGRLALPRHFLGLVGLIAALSATSAIAKDAKPLFADDSTINIQLIAPFRDLVKKAPNSTDSYPASLILLGGADAAGEKHVIELSARGNSRRDTIVCKFPPLRVVFTENPVIFPFSKVKSASNS